MRRRPVRSLDVALLAGVAVLASQVGALADAGLTEVIALCR